MFNADSLNAPVNLTTPCAALDEHLLYIKKAAFLSPNEDILQHTTTYNEIYSIILPVCTAARGVQNMSKYPGAVGGGDSNQSARLLPSN